MALTSFAAVVPSTPLNFKVTESGSGTISIAWDPSEFDGGSSLYGYYAYYKLTSASSYTKSTLILPNENTFIITGLTSNSNYQLYMAAANIKGESVITAVLYQVAGSVATGLTAPSIVDSTRTDYSI